MGILSLNTYNDLLFKCRQEFLQLQNCFSHPEYDFVLVNIILGMNHLFEWYLKDEEVSKEQKLECIKIFNPFASLKDVSVDFKTLYREHSVFPKPNLQQEVIRNLCNKAKHFKKRKIEWQKKHYTAISGSPVIKCGNPNAVCGAYDHYLYFVELDGQDINLSDLISILLEKWATFVNNEQT